MKKLLVWAVVVTAAIVLPTALAASGAVHGQAVSAQSAPPLRQAPPYNPAKTSALKSPTLDSQLVALQQTSLTKGGVAAVDAADSMGLSTTGTRVRVIVETTDPLAARAAVDAAGGTVEASAGDLLRAAVDPANLSRLSRSTGVSYVRPPSRPAADATPDEGVASTNASAWQALGRSGAGVKVAIIDLGFQGYAAAQAAGDLPASLTTVDDCDGNLANGEVHGTAVAEIVHKMAPDAQLTLICVEDEVSLANAEQYVVDHGIKIVNHSVAWFNTSRGDGKGAADTPDGIVKDARANGVLWVNAAGNYGKGGHWSGALTAGINQFQAIGKLNGQTYYWDPVWIPYGETECFDLKWDKWPTTHEDFDLLIYDNDPQNPNLVAVSSNDQDGENLPPTEGLCYQNTTESDPNNEWFYAAVANFHATTKPRADLFAWPYTTLAISTAAGSLTEPATSPSALAVGAICWQNNAIESYSSQGPTIDGRVKPDISGPDATSSPVYGPFETGGCGQSGFTGTSAASPHVAGAAALVEGVHPTWTPDQVQSFLTGNAQDLGSSGKDSTFGSGGLRLVLQAPKITSFSPSAAAVGTTVTISGSNLAGSTLVDFNGATVTPTSVTATSLKAVVPDGALTGKVHITNADGVGTSTTDFKVLPSVTSFDPAFDIRGHDVTIHGHTLTGATKVTFNGVSAAFAPVNDDTLTATIPSTATTGKIAVTTAGGVATSAASFTVVLPPTVTSLSPTSGTFGQTVTIAGTNLAHVSDATLGSTELAITPVSDTQLKITIPDDAVTGTFHLTNPAGPNSTSPTFKVLPRVDSFDPGHDIRGAQVVIHGHELGDATKVTFNGIADPSFSHDSDTQITAHVPASATTGKIAVTNAGGIGTSTGSFTVVLAPTVSSVSPTSASFGQTVTLTGTNLGFVSDATLGATELAITPVSDTQLKIAVPDDAVSGAFHLTNPAGSNATSPAFKVLPRVDSFTPTFAIRGDSVTIHGHNFTGTTKVTFNGVSATFTPGVDSQTIDATVPATATTGKIAVTTPGGTGTSTGSFTVVLPPTVSSASPTSASFGQTVTLNGTNLAHVSAAKLAGTDVAITPVSDTQLKITVPDDAISGAFHLTNPAGSNPTSPAFKVLPRVDSFDPVFAIRGDSVTIHGHNFTGTTKVTFNGVTDLTASFVDSQTIDATVPPTATTGKIAVTTPGGTGTSAASFTVVLLPTVSSFSPTSAAFGGTVTITGTNLAHVSDVKLGSTTLSFTTVSDTQLRFTVPDGATTDAFHLTNPAGSNTVTSTSPKLKVLPRIDSFTPTFEIRGNPITITGHNFTGATKVTFNGVSAAFTFDDAQTITATIPLTATTGKLAVTTAGGTGTSTASFTVVLPPTVSSFSPTSAPVESPVTINGTNLAHVSDAKLGTNELAITPVSDTQLKVTIPVGASTGPLHLTNPAGTNAVAPTFKVLPRVDSFDTSPAGHGAAVTVHGHNFTGATKVTFNGASAPVDVVDDDTITTTIPGTATTGKVAVTTPSGTGTSAGSFVVVLPATVSSFSPASGAVWSTITITGTNLAYVDDVTVGGADVGTPTQSGSQIKVTVKDGAVTGKLQLHDAAGWGPASSGTFKVVPSVTGADSGNSNQRIQKRGGAVTISGHAFTGATKVTFNGVTDPTATVVDSQTIDATVPATATTGKIAVTTPSGTGTSTFDFTVVLPPTITSFSPASGPAGTLVTIHGTNLDWLNYITINDGSNGLHSSTATQATALVEENGDPTGSIKVRNVLGDSASMSGFTITPTVTSVSPDATTGAAVGDVVTVNGRNLVGASATFNGVAAGVDSNWSGAVTIEVPTGATTGPLVVTTPGGTVDTGTYKINRAITGFTPDTAGPGDRFAIAGTNLAGVTSVQVNGVDAQFTTTDGLQATVPAGATSGPVTVTTSAGTATSPAAFTVVSPLDPLSLPFF